MLQETIRFDVPSPGGDQDCVTPGSAAEMAFDLVARLRQSGLETGLIRSATGITAGGADLQVVPGRLEESRTSKELVLRRVAGLAQDGVPVTIAVRELGPGEKGIDLLEEFCRSVRNALDADSTLMSRVSLSLRSHQVPLQAYFLVSRALLGDGRRFVILDSLQMQHHKQARVQEETERNWLCLWRHRAMDNPLTPAYGASVRTGCPLLGDEAAEAVLPLSGLQVPAGSAWLPVTIDLRRYADELGHIIWEELQPALEAAVDIGDQLLDVLSWMTPSQQSDAWLNRRLAVIVTNIGDVVHACGHDPVSLDCLRWIDAVISRTRAILWGRSHEIAGQAGVLPALCRSDPSGGLGDHSYREDWQRRWRLALANAAVRHRNLLVMSPYSLLPEKAEDTAPFVDLLPVLCHADAFAFVGTAHTGDWNIGQFRKFHSRAWAVMQRRNARSLIAAKV